MSEQEETQNAGAVSPALPDGIGLTLDDVRALLAKEHETIVPKDDPMLMIVTLLNAYLGEVDKLHARHGKALAALMAGKRTPMSKEFRGPRMPWPRNFPRPRLRASAKCLPNTRANCKASKAACGMLRPLWQFRPWSM